MSSASDTVTKQLYKAVIALASGHGVVQERLAHVYVSYLADLNVADLPDDVRSEYEAIRDALKRMHPEGGKLDGMDRDACTELARRLIIVYDAVIK